MIPILSGGKFPQHLIRGLFIIIIGVLGAPTTALAQVVHLPPIQFVMAISGPCVSTDAITLSGQIETTVYIRPDGSGGMHVTVRTLMKGRGTTADLVVNPKSYVVNSE